MLILAGGLHNSVRKDIVRGLSVSKLHPSIPLQTSIPMLNPLTSPKYLKSITLAGLRHFGSGIGDGGQSC